MFTWREIVGDDLPGRVQGTTCSSSFREPQRLENEYVRRGSRS